MKVLLLNIDSKLPNIALKKIEMFHKLQGDEVVWDMPMMLGVADKTYASCIFARNYDVVANYKGLYPALNVGGTGYDLTVKLPPEIDAMKPKINYGFTTRGCVRRCAFCVVPKAEGNIRVVGDIYDVWDGHAKSIVLYDNNILALPKHFTKICNQLVKEDIAVDFNQGMDIRLVTPEICELFNKLKFTDGLRFSFDHPSLEKAIRAKVKLLRKFYKRKYILFYILVGYDTTFEEDIHRLQVIKELGCRAYIMRHENTPREKRYIRMAQWANQFWTFGKFDFETFCVKYEE
jgi:hypothetical protein|tara:strand:+ start:369 stop:1238 length:870 start_codon:yes stop_codon:yes gene_type:complete